MQISTPNLNFKAKNPIIKQADKAIRIIHRDYPMLSSTKSAKFNVVKNNNRNRNIVKDIISSITLMRMRITSLELNETPFEFYNKFLKTLKKHRLGNCGEQVKLLNFILDLNGIRAEKALLGPSGLNHCVSIIPLTKNAINDETFKKTPMNKLKNILIADPWLDVIGSPQKIANLYKNNYFYQKFLGDSKTAINVDVFFNSEHLDNIYLHPVIGSQHPVSKEMRASFKTSNPELFFK